jgi:hypothetical protein
MIETRSTIKGVTPVFSEIDLLRKYEKYDVGLNPRYYYLDG